MAIQFNRNFNVNRVVKRLVRTVLALYVGGTIMTTFGSVMTCTYSSFYEGLSLIGWTVSDLVNATSVGGVTTVGGYNGGQNCTIAELGIAASGTQNNVITSISGSGVLAVVGIIAIAQIVTEFVSW